jgi:hypothetical protein
MPAIQFAIDLHCHPQYKAFARAHLKNGEPPVQQSASASHRSSLWYYDPPSVTDKLLNYFLSITKFSQNNLTAALYGRLWVMVLGLGSVEKFFFKNKLGTGAITDVVDDFVAEFGKPRINAIESMKDYWQDLLQEISFLKDQENHAVKIDGHWYTYNLPVNFVALQQNISLNEAAGAGESKNKPLIISILPSIEGLHVLNCGLENKCTPAEVIQNTLALKQLPHAPWFVTFSHHFYNELCGHARSLRNEIGKLTNQEEGINSGFTALGKEVLELLLDETKGRRIFIDIKHMSVAGRKEWLALRSSKYKETAPVIISHGVSNGLPFAGAQFSNYPELGNQFINPIDNVKGGDGEFKDHNLINFYDEEIIEVVMSNGIMGLQLDERRLANEDTVKKVKHSVFRNKIMHYRSELLWKQIQYIAEMLDDHGLYAWGNMAIGSDYDGLVDPLNSFWTAEQYDDLASYLERHAYNYFKDYSHRLKNEFNKIGADQVVQQIFQENAWNFLKKWY